VQLAGERYTGYYSPWVPLTRADIDLVRSGGDLVLSAPDVVGYYGPTPGSSMVLERFFTRGLTTVTIDGVVNDVSELA
jgi:hypothetical protein